MAQHGPNRLGTVVRASWLGQGGSSRGEGPCLQPVCAQECRRAGAGRRGAEGLVLPVRGHAQMTSLPIPRRLVHGTARPRGHGAVLVRPEKTF